MKQMTIEDIMAFKENAGRVLRDHGQFATAQATELAFNALACIEQYRWERDVAIGQLEELDLSFGQKIDGVYITKEEYEKLLEYKHMYEDLCK